MLLIGGTLIVCESNYSIVSNREYINPRGFEDMTNNQNTNNLDETNTERTTAENEAKGFELSNQGQNLGGGKGDERTIDVGETSGGDEFSKTDQSITQAAPGQTVTNTTQGGSNA